MNPCDQEIFEKGHVVTVTHTLSSEDIEEWCKAASEIAGFAIDWHWVAGRAVVKTLGDLTTATKALSAVQHIHDEGMKRALAKLRLD